MLWLNYLEVVWRVGEVGFRRKEFWVLILLFCGLSADDNRSSNKDFSLLLKSSPHAPDFDARMMASGMAEDRCVTFSLHLMSCHHVCLVVSLCAATNMAFQLSQPKQWDIRSITSCRWMFNRGLVKFLRIFFASRKRRSVFLCKTGMLPLLVLMLNDNAPNTIYSWTREAGRKIVLHLQLSNATCYLLVGSSLLTVQRGHDNTKNRIVFLKSVLPPIKDGSSFRLNYMYE